MVHVTCVKHPTFIFIYDIYEVYEPHPVQCYYVQCEIQIDSRGLVAAACGYRGEALSVGSQACVLLRLRR